MWTNITGTDRVRGDRVTGEKWWETYGLADCVTIWENEETGVQVPVTSFGRQLEEVTGKFLENLTSGLYDAQKLLMKQSQTLADRVDTNVPRLQKDQVAWLRQNYNPRNMSEEDYDALLDDLIRLGVITEQEKRYLNFTNCWILQPSGAGVMPDTFMEPPFNFASCGGNVYELARFHSQVEWLPYHGYGRFQDAQALTFGKLLNVFNQMGVR